MTENPLLYPILIFIIFPVIIFGLFKRKERRIHKLQVQVLEATLIKEEKAQSEKKKRKKKSGIAVKLIHLDSNNYLLVLLNIGNVTLRNVEMDLLLEEHEDNPFLTNEFEKKFPIGRLLVDNSVTLNATQYTGSPLIYNIRLRWTEPGGARIEDQVYVNV